ncbi:MAG: phage tail protein [Dehalococcoidia bacterium]
MATERNRPYSAFNYLVDLGGGDGTDSVRAGFQEVSGLSVEITMQEYRAGNDRLRNAPIKVAGLYKVPDVSLKRGVIGATDLTEWLDQARRGDPAALREEVTIELRSEDHETTVMTWRLRNVQPMKYTGPTLSGAAAEVGIEELMLSVEEIVFE